VSVPALVNHHAKRAIFSSLALSCFPDSHKGHDLRKDVIENKMFVLILFASFV